MKARHRITIAASIGVLGCLIASMLVLRRVDQIRPQATLEEVLYISSPKVLKRISLGYEGLLADIYWTRAVQYFGYRHYNNATNYNLLGPLLEITTALDPHLVPAYHFGASFLSPAPPWGAGQPDRAIQLMEYGIQKNPNEWHLYYDLGFVYYMDLKNYAKASQAFDQGSQVPGSHPFLKILAAKMAAHAGEYETSRMLWRATYESSHDSLIRQNALDHLRALKVDEDVTHLQAAVTRFGERTGRLPSSFAELIAAEGLRGVPVDPDGNPYRLTREGRILVEKPDDFSFITKGTPPGYKPPFRKR